MHVAAVAFVLAVLASHIRVVAMLFFVPKTSRQEDKTKINHAKHIVFQTVGAIRVSSVFLQCLKSFVSVLDREKYMMVKSDSVISF